jgi:two-component system, response regulator YesN
MFSLLIVEDEATIREGLMDMIDWHHYDIEVLTPCKDGLEGYHAFMNQKPDILLTDIKMPKMNGIELLKKIKETENNFEAILLSGYGEFSYAKEGIRLGALDYLLKPCIPDEILHSVLKAKTKLENVKVLEKTLHDLKRSVEEIEHSKQNSNVINEEIQAKVPVHKTVRSAVDIIQLKYNQNITLDLLAKEVFVSTAYLSSLFKQELGINFLDYLHKYRINEAKKLLKDGLKVYAVAKMVGYQDERHFSTTFKKWTGITPSDFQRTT